MGVILPALLAAAVVLLLPTLRCIVCYFAEVIRAHWLTRHVPGPSAWPVLGHLPLLMEIWSDPHAGLLALRRQYGGVFRLWMLDRISIAVMNPEDLEVVCTHPALASKARQYSVFRSHLGNGLVNMKSGPDYRRHRKAITPSLHLDILQDFVPTFAKNAEKLAERLEELAPTTNGSCGKSVDVKPLFGMIANQSVTETVLSSKLSTLADALGETLHALDRASELIMWRSLRPWWENDIIFRLSSKYREFQQSASAMHRAVLRILQQKIDDVSHGVLPPPRKRMAFLDHVLRSTEGGSITREELNDELKTFLFAGSTTSMDFLSIVAIVLALRPDVQLKIQEELDQVFGEVPARRVQPDDLPHLLYLERVLKEVLRFAPPAPMLFRHAAKDVQLPSGYVVPRGASVIILPGGTHRDTRFFPDPERFDPDRFLPENTRGRHPYAYIPFSAGTRNCIGQRYAMMFAKTVMATVLRRVCFVCAPEGPQSLDEIQVQLGVTMSVKGGALVRVERRVPGGTHTIDK